MNAAVNDLTRAVTGKGSLEQCSLQELQQLCSNYPWFAPAQLLLAHKLKADAPDAFPAAYQRASLYFPNALQLSDRFLEQVYENEPESDDAPVAIPFADANEAIPAVLHEEDVAEPQSDDENRGPVHEQPADRSNETSPEAEVSDEQDTGPDSQPGYNAEPINVSVDDDESIDSPSPLQERAVDTLIPKHTVLESPYTTEEIVDQTRGQHHHHQAEQSLEQEPSLQIAALKIEPIDPQNAPLTFEPYHTIDYFASQGIKFREDEKPKDRFSQQLKSFTEWLKAMKKTPVADLAAGAAVPEEKRVVQMAEVSISDRDVVTEAMAEVWEKQGNHEKATDTYRKLSLINPSKSAYFAAKIEQLNKQFS